MKKLNNQGFGAVEAVLITLVVVVLGFVGYRAYTVYTDQTSNDQALSTKREKQKKDAKEEETDATEQESPTVLETKPAASANTTTVAGYTFTLPNGWKTSGSAKKVENIGRTAITLVPNSVPVGDAKVHEVQLYVEKAEIRKGKSIFFIEDIVQSQGSKTVNGKLVKDYVNGDGLDGHYSLVYTFATNQGKTQFGTSYVEAGSDKKIDSNSSLLKGFRQQLREIAASYRK